MDQHLRQLERDASVGGAEEQAAVLRYRMRIGTLDETRLNFAAYLEDDAALIAQDNWIHSDHINGICPCGNCKMWQGIRVWLDGAKFWLRSFPRKEEIEITRVFMDAIIPPLDLAIRPTYSAVPEGALSAAQEAAIPWLLRSG